MPKNKIKIVFIGTPEFAVPALEALANDPEFAIQLVITKPDAKIGRKQDITPPPVKISAQKLKLQVSQPEKISSAIPEIAAFLPDVIIVVAYSQIIPESILNIPKYGCVNVHGSLLPAYRGAACIQAAIMNGDKETGVTIMKMDKNLDTGPILSQKKIEICENDTTGTVYAKLSKMAALLLTTTIKQYVTGKIKPVAQDNKLASLCKTIKKEDGSINWSKSAKEIERFIRAMQPWPGAFTIVDGLHIKIITASPQLIDIKGAKPGQLFLYEDKLAIQASDQALEILEIQPSGKKVLNAKSFLNGYKKFIYNA